MRPTALSVRHLPYGWPRWRRGPGLASPRPLGSLATRLAWCGALASLVAASGCGGGELGAQPPGGLPDGAPADGAAPGSAGLGFAAATSKAWEGTGSWPILVSADAPAAAAITVTVSVAGGTASAADATLPLAVLTLPAGERAAQLLVPIVDDAVAEPAETLQLVLAVSGGKLAADRASHTLTLLDNDAALWPGAATVSVADPANRLGANLSGLTYEAASGAQPARMWAVKNGPSLIYRLEKSGGLWAPSPGDGWANGKTLRYPGGAGSPDAESVTRAGAALYVATERDNDGGPSRPGVLRFDPSGSATTLDATHEWNLTADLPPVDANAGFEAITWIPDVLLVARGFRDDTRGKPYDPADYPGHGDGLFALGLEGNGMIYLYALDHRAGAGAGPGAFSRVASFASGHAAVMALERDGDLLWAGCDDTCDGALTIFTIDDNPRSPTHGRFVLRRRLPRPAGLPNLNDEGIALAPDSECVDQRKPFFWTDDGATGGSALRQGSVACGAW